ncbi:hypothetical protein CALVIDRAFT_542499 [Calocera viscosa TUFC12733]|uniref:Proteasome assembly chaperone 1 n=1 Tax=Calocera viscosa (strain TUFC12733) TaxID=1330018 RepID=A0A167GJW7_CALVF|nr:hypothetical protein CALVIDRAFT_542499 [Calocera viscosa TUFC12733]
MDNEPLLDTHAPRYAVESDSEDEFETLSSSTAVNSESVQVVLPPNIKVVPKLLLASGMAGLQWSRGVTLSSPVGDILVGSSPVGTVYMVEESHAVVHINCTIPSSICFPLAIALVSAFQPEEVVVLDSYAAPTYISDAPLSPYEAPIRILCTSEKASLSMLGTSPFRPPNLVQLLPAAMMTVLEVGGTPGAAVLLPSLHVSMPLRSEPMPLDDLADSPWSQQVMTTANTYLTTSLGSTQFQWTLPTHGHTSTKARRSARPIRGDVVGEGSMYI